MVLAIGAYACPVAGSAFFSETGIGLRHEGVGVQEGG
jgi:hypothetical protein